MQIFVLDMKEVEDIIQWVIGRVAILKPYWGVMKKLELDKTPENIEKVEKRRDEINSALDKYRYLMGRLKERKAQLE